MKILSMMVLLLCLPLNSGSRSVSMTRTVQFVNMDDLLLLDITRVYSELYFQEQLLALEHGLAKGSENG